jgi:hypothetical protein
VELSELDHLEISGHTFEEMHLDHRGEFWLCDIVVDGVKRTWIEPSENVYHMNNREFENYMKAQSLGAPHG